MGRVDTNTGRTRKAARREFRLSEQDDELLVEAAGLLGVSISEFIVAHAVADAEAVVRAHHVIELNADAYNQFMAALDAPPAGNVAWADAVRRARPLKSAD